MNPYQVMGIITICMVLFSGVVTLLITQGVHILLALLGVYLFAVWSMLSMQRKARNSFRVATDDQRRHLDGLGSRYRARVIDFGSVER